MATKHIAIANPSGENKPLNEREEAFIREYLLDYNATQAAIRAGYDKSYAYQMGYRMLRKVEVSERLAEHRKYLSDEAHIDRLGYLQMLMTTYHRAMQAEEVMKYDPQEKCMVSTGTYEFDGKTAANCLALIGKLLGFIDNKTQNVSAMPLTGIQLNIFGGGPVAQKVGVELADAQLYVPSPADESNLITVNGKNHG